MPARPGTAVKPEGTAGAKVSAGLNVDRSRDFALRDTTRRSSRSSARILVFLAVIDLRIHVMSAYRVVPIWRPVRLPLSICGRRGIAARPHAIPGARRRRHPSLPGPAAWATPRQRRKRHEIGPARSCGHRGPCTRTPITTSLPHKRCQRALPRGPWVVLRPRQPARAPTSSPTRQAKGLSPAQARAQFHVRRPLIGRPSVVSLRQSELNDDLRAALHRRQIRDAAWGASAPAAAARPYSRSPVAERPAEQRGSE